MGLWVARARKVHFLTMMLPYWNRIHTHNNTSSLYATVLRRIWKLLLISHFVCLFSLSLLKIQNSRNPVSSVRGGAQYTLTITCSRWHCEQIAQRRRTVECVDRGWRVSGALSKFFIHKFPNAQLLNQITSHNYVLVLITKRLIVMKTYTQRQHLERVNSFNYALFIFHSRF